MQRNGRLRATRRSLEYCPWNRTQIFLFSTVLTRQTTVRGLRLNVPYLLRFLLPKRIILPQSSLLFGILFKSYKIYLERGARVSKSTKVTQFLLNLGRNFCENGDWNLRHEFRRVLVKVAPLSQRRSQATSSRFRALGNPTRTPSTSIQENAAPVADSGIARTAVFVNPHMRCVQSARCTREVSSGVPIVGTPVENLQMPRSKLAMSGRSRPQNTRAVIAM